MIAVEARITAPQSISYIILAGRGPSAFGSLWVESGNVVFSPRFAAFDPSRTLRGLAALDRQLIDQS